MVPIVCLLAALPLAFAGMVVDQNQMMAMMHQQMMMQQQQHQQQQAHQGWGGNNGGHAEQGGQWWNMMSADDHEAYMKWCEERKRAMAEQKQQKELLEMWEKQEEARKAEMEKARHAKEAAERHENMMAQWKTWQMRINQQHEFDDRTHAFAEQKHAYLYMVTLEFLKFCRCTDFTAELERYFVHDGVTWSNHDDWDLDDLDGIEVTDARDVANRLNGQPKPVQIKAFFGGMATYLCRSARSYVEQVMEWERTYNFLDKWD